jgi:hypothetical protein
LELKEGEDGAGEWDEEAEDAEEGGVSWLQVSDEKCKGKWRIIPSLLARSPFAAEGWKKRRSYWSALSDIVT